MYVPSQYPQSFATNGNDNKSVSVIPSTTLNVKNPLVAELKKMLD